MTVPATIRQAIQEQPGAVREGVALLFSWAGYRRPAERADFYRIAYLVGLGHPPARAAARELGYRLARAYDAGRQSRNWQGDEAAA